MMNLPQARNQLRLSAVPGFLQQNLAETQDVAQRIAQVMARGADAIAQRQNGSGSCRSRRSRRPRLSQWASLAAHGICGGATVRAARSASIFSNSRLKSIGLVS